MNPFLLKLCISFVWLFFSDITGKHSNRWTPANDQRGPNITASLIPARTVRCVLTVRFSFKNGGQYCICTKILSALLSAEV